ncbi:MAG: serine/threonine-protein kinase [Planctomycetota bacterium]
MRIGPYDVEQELARGASGVVYRARGPAGELVALKLLLSPRRAIARTRFAREVAALRALEHRHVVRFVDAGDHEGQPWAALELLEGETLAARLERGALTIPEARRLAEQLSEALTYLHDQGVLHRDLKPDNVFLCGEEAVLVDFGLVRDEDAERLTDSGVFLGTPGYWAPELATAEPEQVGPKTDVYGLGAVLYAALTQRAPIEADSLQAFLETVRFQRVVSPRRLRAEVPDWLSTLCMRCLAFAPPARPAAHQVRECLATEVAPSMRGEAPPLQAPRLTRRRLGPGALATLAAVAAVLALVGGLLAVLEGDVEPTQIAVDEPRPVTEGLVESEVDAVPDPLSEVTRLVWEGALDVALTRCDDALRRDPFDYDAGAKRAQVYLLQGRLGRAAQELEGVLELAPHHPRALLRRGQLAGLRGDVKEALHFCDRALALAPEDWEAHLVRAELLAGAAMPVEAGRAFARAQAYAPPERREDVLLARRRSER